MIPQVLDLKTFHIHLLSEKQITLIEIDDFCFSLKQYEQAISCHVFYNKIIVQCM